MKTKIAFLIYFGTIFCALAQSESLPIFQRTQSLNIEAGYAYSFDNSSTHNFHLLNLGINKTTKAGGSHGGGAQYGAATEIALNSHQFFIGPKVNIFLFFGGLVIGSEIITYTDFNNYSLRYVPIFGFGNTKGKLTVNPHLIITNKDFPSINGLATFTYNISVKKKKI